MKLGYGIFFAIFLLIILTAGVVSASDAIGDNLTVENAADDTNNNLAVDEADGSLQANDEADVSLKEDSNADVVKSAPAKTKVKFSNDIAKYKKSKYFKIKITDKKTKKPKKPVCRKQYDALASPLRPFWRLSFGTVYHSVYDRRRAARYLRPYLPAFVPCRGRVRLL